MNTNDNHAASAPGHRLVGHALFNLKKFDFLSYWIGILFVLGIYMIFHSVFLLSFVWALLMVLYNIFLPPNVINDVCGSAGEVPNATDDRAGDQP